MVKSSSESKLPSTITTQPERWHSIIEQFFVEHDDPSPDWTNELLAQYGIKSANDVIAFLKSPAGEIVQKLIDEEIALLDRMQERQNQDNQDEETTKQHFIASLLLAAIYKEKVEEQEHDRKIEEEINKNLAKTEPAAVADPVKEIAQTFAAYNLSAKIISNDLEKKLLEAKEIEDEMAELEEQGELIDQRNDSIETNLQLLNTFHEELEEKHGKANAGAKIADIENKIAALKGQINQKREQIDTMIEAGHEKEASLHLHELYGLHMQQAGLRDMLSVIRQEKSFYDSDGKITSSFKGADFLLANEQKIVKSEGKYYLLTEDQDFNSMGPEEKSKAEQRYAQAAPDISSLKKVVLHNKTQEKILHNEKINHCGERSEVMQEDILKLTNQLNQIQAAQADLAAIVQHQKTNPNAVTTIPATPTPRPTPTATTTSSAKRVQLMKPMPNYSMTQSYRHVLELMKYRPTQEAIERLKKGFVLPNGQPNLDAQNKITNTLKPGVPISPATLVNLLKYLVTVSGSTYRPMSQAQIQAQAQAQAAKQQPKPPAPTPLSTKPY
jgi:effector protein LidA